MISIGVDVGSTTLKCVVLDEENRIIFHIYKRHFAQIKEKLAELLENICEVVGDSVSVNLALSGSAAMGISESCGIPFVQEVYATRTAVAKLAPQTDCAIELGGEDAKILFFGKIPEVRMNGSCAGGTGAFIDQMATLLDLTPDELNRKAAGHKKIYSIASRCGVFAKSDIQPLLNQGAAAEDICASIFDAVVNQTVAGLAQGHKIEGNILYLGGPLTFFSELRAAFDRTLNTKGVCPENSLYYVALGAALLAQEIPAVPLNDILNDVRVHSGDFGTFRALPPLFEDEEAYQEFCDRHASHRVATVDPKTYSGDAYLGIDAGSTTVKGALIDPDNRLLLSFYQPNGGNPIPLVKQFLETIYENYPDIRIRGSIATGYGEEMLKQAFSMDGGIVETVAHFRAASHFQPETDFIIDIGGQDIKCFQLRGGAIENIFLNEACSSGCGSFLQTFANAMNLSVEEFAKLGLFARQPVDLGSRCTVFMNSQVKQAQKDGATVADISAGLSISVVKNALYKVIRASSPEQLGRHIVVQGGTFYNDAVLRAFETEMRAEVVRPDIAGLMGAYGAAIYAREHQKKSSSLLNLEALKNFTHTVRTVTCQSCPNHCSLTVNKFGDGNTYISGNRCDRPVSGSTNAAESLNLYQFKRDRLAEYQKKSGRGTRGTVGLPMGLNFYDLLPFWHTFFETLGFSVVVSPPSDRDLYLLGHDTIPSDTVCYPAKLMHGHIRTLVDAGVDTIFYPCMSYNLDEEQGDNHYNCPVVAYYPEVIAANMPQINGIRFIYDYIGLHRKKDFPKKMAHILHRHGIETAVSEAKAAMEAGFRAYDAYLNAIREEGARIIREAERQDLPVIVLAGRPYHTDPEINHGIDRLICSLGAAVVSEDAICQLAQPFHTNVLNQWTYHSRMYAAAHYIKDKPNMYLVQLVSFGCGVDAITTDEVREICERAGKLYTQIKIDEITNLGAVRIRLRSLFAAMDSERDDKTSNI